MLYQFYECMRVTATPARFSSMLTRQLLVHPANPWSQTPLTRHMLACLTFFEYMGGSARKSAFGLENVQINGQDRAVQTRIHNSTAFCDLLEFKAADESGLSPTNQRLTVLLVAPMSGHHASLLRDTVKALLCDCDVYLTDWLDVRDVPMEEGVFDLDGYIGHVLDIIVTLGNEKSNLHVIAISQPGPAVLSAVAFLSEKKSSRIPDSMTFIACPIDPRKNQTLANRIVENLPVKWFKDHTMCTVPFMFKGAGRRVFPGFLQLVGFAYMSPSRHQSACLRYFSNLINGNFEAIDIHELFYLEYNAVMDLSSEFYLQTIDLVFHKAAIATGQMMFQHHAIKPEAISETALMTIEGGKDDISPGGQTQAAHDICCRIPAEKRKHLLKSDAEHYGVFTGRIWREEIAPELIRFMRDNNIERRRLSHNSSQ